MLICMNTDSFLELSSDAVEIWYICLMIFKMSISHAATIPLSNWVSCSGLLTWYLDLSPWLVRVFPVVSVIIEFQFCVSYFESLPSIFVSLGIIIGGRYGDFMLISTIFFGCFPLLYFPQSFRFSVPIYLFPVHRYTSVGSGCVYMRLLLIWAADFSGGDPALNIRFWLFWGLTSTWMIDVGCHFVLLDIGSIFFLCRFPYSSHCSMFNICYNFCTIEIDGMRCRASNVVLSSFRRAFYDFPFLTLILILIWQILV